MNQEKYRPSALSGIALRVIALVLALWLGAMCLLTWAVARDLYQQLDLAAQNYVEQMSERSATLEYWDLPGEMEATMIRQLGFPYSWIQVEELLPIMSEPFTGFFSNGEKYVRRLQLEYSYEAAVQYSDTSSGITIGTGNYLYFPYVYDTDWAAQNLDPRGYAYIDLDATPDGHEIDSFISDTPTGDLTSYYFLPLLRITGHFQGNEFHPVKVERVPSSALPNATGTGLEYYCQRDNDKPLAWETLLDHSGETDIESVTIYAWDSRGYSTFIFHELLTPQLLPDLITEHLTTGQDLTQNSLRESIIIHSATHTDHFGHFSITLALRCWPLEYAALRLWQTYLISFLLCALLVWLFLRRVKWELIVPLRQANQAAEGRPELRGTDYDPLWWEPYETERHIARLLQADHDNKTELQQLKTALDYAKNAEENRRQLVSNITHELKTPLAVVHSYAEGLQAGIAGEDTDRYLDVIRDEATKMDAMVMQMLDLSRLEAGKVRLQTENFSLLVLAKSIAETMIPMAEAKNLRIGWDYTEECCPLADKSRIQQVITNLLSNAVRYTPPGGDIRITVYEKEGFAHLYVENTSPPLSEEALTCVFDSFYQTDASRNSGGTGLGLAIVKSIVELHRGSCSVSNTPTGVRFGFRVPLS